MTEIWKRLVSNGFVSRNRTQIQFVYLPIILLIAIANLLIIYKLITNKFKY